MSKIIAVLLVLGLGTMPTIMGAAEPAVEGEVKLEAVSFVDLEKAIAAHKGKVVLIDVWADFCLPCKQKFPHIVEMQKKRGGEGLVVISLSVDEPENKAKTLAFLKKNHATFQNFILEDTDENKEKWEKTFAHTSPPIAHLYDRTGKKVRTFETEKSFKDLEPMIETLLKTK